MNSSVQFQFSVGSLPTVKLPLVSGAVDLDRNLLPGSPLESEKLNFIRAVDKLVWRATISVPEPTQGMEFYIQYTIGAPLKWSLRVTKIIATATGPAEVELYELSDQQTLFPSDSLQAEFKR